LLGIVKDLNFAPKGEVDGLILDVGGATVQVNLPPDRASGASELVGQTVELTVGPEPKAAEHPKGDHPVRKLIAFEGDHARSPDHGRKPPLEKPKHEHGPGESAEVSGTVRRLNFAKHGEANGVVLDGGDFAHLKPDGMRRAGLKVGQEVTARGKSKPVPTEAGGGTGARAIEAEVVNGLELGPKKPR